MLPLILVAPIVLLWLPMAPRRALRWRIAAVLAVWATLMAALAALFPRASAETALASFTVAGFVAVAAWLVEAGRPGGQTRWWRLWPLPLMLFWCVIPCTIIGGVGIEAGASEPSTDGILPLPAGLHATVAPFTADSCDLHDCTRTIDITGRPGQDSQDLYQEVQRHLAGNGWITSCRPNGWLIDQSFECIDTTWGNDQVHIELTTGDSMLPKVTP